MAFSFIATRASRNLSSRFCLFFVASHFLSLWAAPLHWIVQCACAYLPPPRNGAFEHVHTFSKLYNTACNCFPAKPISSSKNAANPNSRAIAANYVRICSATTTTTTKTIQGYQSHSGVVALACVVRTFITSSRIGNVEEEEEDDNAQVLLNAPVIATNTRTAFCSSQMWWQFLRSFHRF